MNSRDMARHMTTNPDGGSFALDGSDLPTVGYYVGGLVSPLILDGDTPVEDVKDVERFIDHLKSAVDGVTHVRWWTDEDLTWVYGASWTDRYIDAEATCQERRQWSFYAIEQGRWFEPILVP